MGIQLGIGLTGQRLNASPARLFSVTGSRGFMYDLSDYGSQWQDTGATVPITSTAQSVARVNDLSGLGNHATQATAGSRSLTTTFGAGFRGIQFDGVDDFYTTAAIDFSNSDEVTVVAGVRKLSDAAQRIVELTADSATNSGSFGLFMPTGSIYRARSRGTLQADASSAAFAAPDSAVLSFTADISGDAITLRRNGVQVGFAGNDQGPGNYSNAPLYIGRQGGTSLPFNGVLTFLFAINRLLTANELASVEAFANSRTGAY